MIAQGLESIIVGKSGFKVCEDIYAALSDYKSDIMNQTKRVITLVSIHTQHFSVVENTRSQLVQLVLYCTGEQLKHPPHHLVKMLVYRMLSSHTQVLSPRVVQYLHDLIGDVIKVCADGPAQLSPMKQVTAAYLNDVLLKLIKDPILSMEQMQDSGLFVSSVSSIDASHQNYLHQLQEKLKKRFVLCGVASVLSVVNKGLYVPVVEGNPLIQLASPFAQDSEFVEEAKSDKRSFSLEIDRLEAMTCLPFHNVFIQNPFQVLAETTPANRAAAEKAVLVHFFKISYNDLFSILRQSVDNTLQFKLSSGESIYDSIAFSSLQSPSNEFSQYYIPSYMDFNVAITKAVGVIKNAIPSL